MGDFDPPGVTDRAKDLGAMLVAWWLVAPDATNLAAEPFRESTGGEERGPAVHEHEFEAFVSASPGEIFEYEFDGPCLARRGGDNSHAEWQTGDVHADDSLGPVGSTIGTTLVVEGAPSVRCSSCEMGVDDHHRGLRVSSTKGGA